MNSILQKTGILVIVIMGAFLVYFILDFNVSKQIHKLAKRTQFEVFLNDQFSAIFLVNEIGENNPVEVDMPDIAALQDYFITIDPELKYVPKERLKEAYKQTKELEHAQFLKSTTQLEWQEAAANIGGRTRDIMWDPVDPAGNKVWAGCVTGGLWYNNDITDESSSWTAVDDFWQSLSVSSITYDPNDPNTFYVGTGEAQTALIIYRESSGLGYGILKSTDAGLSWNVIPFTENFTYVTDIEVRNENGTSAIYAAVVSGTYMGSPHQSNPSDGLWRSIDGGDNWEQILPNILGLDFPYSPSDIEIGSDGRIYVGTMPNLMGEGGATILYSDEGLSSTWTVNEEYKVLIENTPDFNLPGRVMLASAPSDENIVYALVAQGYFMGLPGYECHIIAKSEDKGENFTMVNKPPNNPNVGNWAFIAWHALTATVDPNNPNKLYAGGLDINRSEDGGIGWEKISDWILMYSGGGDNYVHGDIHKILFRPGSGNESIISTDGGIFYSPDITAIDPVFEERNIGFNTLQTYKCAISPLQGSQNYLAGFQDNCTLLYGDEPVTINDILSGGDGGSCFWDQDEPEIFITSYQYNRFKVFVNGNLTTNLTNIISGNFISSADYDYKLNNIYANAAWFHTIWQDSIIRFAGLPTNVEVEFLNMGTGSTVPFTHVKYSPFSPDGSSTLFLGTQSGRLFRVEQANEIPQVNEIGSQEFPTGSISCVAIGGSEDTLLVTFSNYGVSSVWQTYDAGGNWTEKEGNLPDMPIRWAIFNPYNAKAALLATEIGIWSTYNLDETEVSWVPDNLGLANVRVDMLQLREADNRILAGTHGRGLFTTTYDYNPVTAITINTFKKLDIYPNPTSGKLYFKFDKNSSEQVLIEIFDSGNKLVKSFTIKQNNSISGNCIDITELSPGLYLIKTSIGGKLFANKILKK
jgi:hypothetical protein